MIKRTMISLAFTAAFSFVWTIAVGQTKDPLLFPKDNFTVETRTVKTSSGEKTVTYHSYMHILYVAKPVDKDYQSMNVSVPVEINDVTVDASNAPIFFAIGVGGYMSVKNAGNGAGTRVDSRADLALASGFVVVSPGCRGRDNKAADGTYYGKAPAAIVDLKLLFAIYGTIKASCLVMLIRLFSVGCSAGGAISALLGTSGNSPLYEPYLKEIGAADAERQYIRQRLLQPYH